jgi:hypothetical protein
MLKKRLQKASANADPSTFSPKDLTAHYKYVLSVKENRNAQGEQDYQIKKKAACELYTYIMTCSDEKLLDECNANAAARERTTALHVAVGHGLPFDSFVRLIKVGKICIDALDEAGRTPIMSCAHSGNPLVVGEMCLMKADLSTIDIGGDDIFQMIRISSHSIAATEKQKIINILKSHGVIEGKFLLLLLLLFLFKYAHTFFLLRAE